MKLDNLTGFLSGYLHQDWDVEYADVYAAADDFGRSEGLDVVLATLGEIAQLVESHPTESDWEAFLLGAGCYYRPTPAENVADWLLTMASRAASTAALRGRLAS